MAPFMLDFVVRELKRSQALVLRACRQWPQERVLLLVLERLGMLSVKVVALLLFLLMTRQLRGSTVMVVMVLSLVLVVVMVMVLLVVV